MNLPNKLTILRIAMIPLFVAVVFISAIPFRFLIGAVLFAVAAITDTLDGQIARKRNLVTDFGKLFDPLADKVFVVSALISLLCLTPDGGWKVAFAVAVMIIIAREFLVTSLRLLVAGKGIVVAAGMMGKIKTTVQMISIIVILIEKQFAAELTEFMGFPHIIGYSLMAVAVIATLISGVQYMLAYKSYIDPQK